MHIYPSTRFPIAHAECTHRTIVSTFYITTKLTTGASTAALIARQPERRPQPLHQLTWINYITSTLPTISAPST